MAIEFHPEAQGGIWRKIFQSFELSLLLRGQRRFLPGLEAPIPLTAVAQQRVFDRGGLLRSPARAPLESGCEQDTGRTYQEPSSPSPAFRHSCAPILNDPRLPGEGFMLCPLKGTERPLALLALLKKYLDTDSLRLTGAGRSEELLSPPPGRDTAHVLSRRPSPGGRPKHLPPAGPSKTG